MSREKRGRGAGIATERPFWYEQANSFVGGATGAGCC